FGSPAGSYCSLGIHESQSRLWENGVGRSRPFWNHVYPRLQQAFPGTFDGVPLEDFYFAVNDVRPSFIRVEADEVTYNLHILLRFELERALLNGTLPVAELPAAWNAKFQELFDLTPSSDAEGCLQDIHWSFGGLGYFPTYTLGNLYAAQFLAAARNELGGRTLDDHFRLGNFRPLSEWLQTNIHVRGRQLLPGPLCEAVTGSPLRPEAFCNAMHEKFAPLYQL
ncbi:MAG: carboxypeptidase M32, partial [Gemmataceae bacterium]